MGLREYVIIGFFLVAEVLDVVELIVSHGAAVFDCASGYIVSNGSFFLQMNSSCSSLSEQY